MGEGFRVGSTTVRAYLAEKRRQGQEVYLPLIWRPGEAAQVDFFDVTVEVGGERRKAWLFVVHLMYSGRDFAWVYERCNQIAFLDGHMRAFEHFGGVVARCIYDNLKAAVKRRVGIERELSGRFAALCWCWPTGTTSDSRCGDGRRRPAHMLWRVKANVRLPVLERHGDGSFRSIVRGSGRDRRRSTGECSIRVVEYRIDGAADECRIRSQNAPANFATVKHMASNLLRRGKGKHSMRSSRHIAAWNEDFLFSLLTT